MTIESGGPYLAMAVLCEKVLQEKDGVLSAIRIVDRIIHTAFGSETPEQMSPVPVNLTALLSFKAGAARGTRTIKWSPQAPSGQRLPEMSFPAFFESEDRGINLVVNLAFQANEEGLYWFDVILEDQLLTRIPLRIVYQRVTPGTSAEVS